MFAFPSRLCSVFEEVVFMLSFQPASVAQPDARGNQEFVGSINARCANILSWRLIVEYFLRSFYPFPLIQGQLSASGERTCTSTG